MTTKNTKYNPNQPSPLPAQAFTGKEMGSGVNTKPSFQDFQNYNVNYYGYKNPSRVIMVEGMPDESGKGSKIRAIYIFNGHPSQTITIYPKSFRHD